MTHFLLYSRLKTKVEGTEEAKGWKIKCRAVYELLVSEFATVTPVEAGKIAKKAFPSLRRQRYHSRNGSSETFYYKIRLLQAELNTTREEPSAAAQLNEVLAKESVIASKNAQIKRMACDHAASVKRIKILEKQKIA